MVRGLLHFFKTLQCSSVLNGLYPAAQRLQKLVHDFSAQAAVGVVQVHEAGPAGFVQPRRLCFGVRRWLGLWAGGCPGFQRLGQGLHRRAVVLRGTVGGCDQHGGNLRIGADLFLQQLEVQPLGIEAALDRHLHVGHQRRAIGLLAVLVLPTILDQVEPGNGTLKLQLVGGFIIATLIPSLALTLFSVPEPPVPATPPVRQSFWRATSVIFSDRLLLRVLASDAVVTAGQSIRASLIVFFAVWYMGLPAWASGLYLLQFIFGVAAAPIWLRIGTRIGKRQAAISGEIAQAAINIGLLFVFPGGLPLLLALTIAQGLTQGSGNLMLRAMVADVADAHRLRTGHDRTGLFFSVFALSAKLGPAIGIGIALPLIAWLGFAAGPHNSPSALEGLKTVFALGPALAHIIATLIIWRFPLDEAAHAEIRRALDQRDAIPA